MEQAEKLLESIVNTSDDVIIGNTLDGIITSWNHGAEKTFGYTAAEAIGQPILMLFPPERVHEEDEILERIKRGETVDHLETVRVRKDGELVDICITVSPITDPVGRIIGVSKIARDITQHNLIEAQLGLLSRVVKQSPNSIVVTDTKGHIEYVNPKFTSLTGYTLEEVLGKNPRILSAGQTPRETYRQMWKAIIAGEEWHGEFFNRKKNGELYCELASVSPIINKLGDITHFVAIKEDITERKKAEDRIAEQAALLDQSQDAIIERDLEGRILFWNKGAERIYGWTREEALGRSLADVLQMPPKMLEEFNLAAFEKGGWAGEVRHLTKTGKKLVLEGRNTLVRDANNHPRSVLVINTDITEKKKIEAQFMRAQRMESIGTLAGGIAHDLNNILAPILLSIDVLKTTSPNSDSDKILDTIKISAQRGADIVRQVLSFARGIEGERVEIQLKHLLKDLDHIIKDTFPKDIRLEFVVPNHIWTIMGDPTQMHQVLLNLSVNARDAMPDGGDLVISVRNCVIDEQYAALNISAKPGRYVKMDVADSGIGIPPDVLDKIFEPFFTTKDVNKGTGLGLSTVISIVKSHEGFVNVYTELGKGTVFSVYLPAIDTSTQSGSIRAQQTGIPRGLGETILVVDDEASILTITGQTLQTYGYHVLTARDGAEAVTLYSEKRHEIALVVTDIMMPVMDGTTAINAFARMNPNVKVIAVSGLNTNRDAISLSDVRVKSFLLKPYSARTLLVSVRQALDGP